MVCPRDTAPGSAGFSPDRTPRLVGQSGNSVPRTRHPRVFVTSAPVAPCRDRGRTTQRGAGPSLAGSGLQRAGCTSTRPVWRLAGWTGCTRPILAPPWPRWQGTSSKGRPCLPTELLLSCLCPLPVGGVPPRHRSFLAATMQAPETFFKSVRDLAPIRHSLFRIALQSVVRPCAPPKV